MALFSNRQEEEVLLENLAMLLEAGVGVTSALESISPQLRNTKIKKVISRIQFDLDSGFPLWKSFEKTGLYSQRAISLMRIGEKSGKLVENLELISQQSQKERSFQSQVQAALFYPLIVFSLTIIVGLGVSWFVLPRLAGVFSSLEIDLPWITKALLALGSFLQSYGAVAVPVLATATAAAFYFLFFFPKTRKVGEAILLAIPGFRNLLLEVEISRFGNLLGGLLQAGIPIDDALVSLRDATLLDPFAKFYEHLQKQVAEGNSIKKGFSSYPSAKKIFPAPVQSLIFAAEQSGQLPGSLVRIGRLFEERSSNTARGVTTALEPIMLFLVWLGVATVAIAVILPIYSLIGGFNP